MNPVRHVGNRDYFESERGKLNDALTFSGLSLGEDAKLRKVTTARTLTEAEAMAGALQKALIERKVHADVLKFCRAELVVDNYFHAVFEAAKSVAEKLRQKPGLSSLYRLSRWGMFFEVANFNSENLSEIRNRPEFTRRTDKDLCVFEHPFLCGVALQMRHLTPQF
jgi:hypothetical protein